jgi:hypothetical protein
MTDTPQTAQAEDLIAAVEAAKGGGDPRINPRDLNVVFATPTLQHNVSLNYLLSLLDTYNHLLSLGAKVTVMARGGDAFIAKVRNKMVTDFLRDFPDTDNFFFLDDDVGWRDQAHKVIEFLLRPDPVVAGVYPKKSKDVDFPTNIRADLETSTLIQDQGLYLADMAPTGFMRIKRHVLETLAAQATEFIDAEENGEMKSYYNIFETGRGPTGQWWGEDYVFCQKCQKAGFPIWVDASIKFHHQGLNNWEGKLADHLHILAKKAKRATREYRKRMKLELKEAAE